jgi:biopolymer transport protein ExbD
MINLKKKNEKDAEIFTSAMNDIMFFLMLFFIIISTLLNPSMINVTLPKSQSSQSIHKKEINLTVTKEMSYFLNNDQVPYGEIENRLKAELQKQPEIVVMLRIDNTLPIQNLVDILSMGNRINTKIVLATAKQKQ